MDYNTPIEITDKSNGLDLLNETRRLFSLRLAKVIEDVMNIPITDDCVATLLSRHILQRLNVMQMLTVLSPEEVEAATELIKTRFETKDNAVLFFSPINHSGYTKYSAQELMEMWRELLQNFVEFSLQKIPMYSDLEKERLISFVKVAGVAAYEVNIISEKESEKLSMLAHNAETGENIVSYRFLTKP